MKKLLSLVVCLLGLSNSGAEATRLAAVQALYSDSFGAQIVDFASATPTAPYIYLDSSDLATQASNVQTFLTSGSWIPGSEPILFVDFTKGDGYVDGSGNFSLSSSALPAALKNLCVTNTLSDVAAIGNDFLKGSSTLENVTGSLPAVTVANNFLQNCTALQGFGLDFPNAASVGSGFFDGYTALTGAHIKFRNSSISVQAAIARFLGFDASLSDDLLAQALIDADDADKLS